MTAPSALILIGVKAATMLLLLAIIFVLGWAGGFFLLQVSALFIHVLLVLAVIALFAHFFTGRSNTV